MCAWKGHFDMKNVNEKRIIVIQLKIIKNHQPLTCNVPKKT